MNTFTKIIQTANAGISRLVSTHKVVFLAGGWLLTGWGISAFAHADSNTSQTGTPSTDALSSYGALVDFVTRLFQSTQAMFTQIHFSDNVAVVLAAATWVIISIILFNMIRDNQSSDFQFSSTHNSDLSIYLSKRLYIPYAVIPNLAFKMGALLLAGWGASAILSSASSVIDEAETPSFGELLIRTAINCIDYAVGVFHKTESLVAWFLDLFAWFFNLDIVTTAVTLYIFVVGAQIVYIVAEMIPFVPRALILLLDSFEVTRRFVPESWYRRFVRRF